MYGNDKRQMICNSTWDDIIANNEPGEIRSKYHLDYIFSTSCVNDKDVLNGKKICVIAHMTYFQLMESCFEYLEKVPDEIDIYVTTNEMKRAERIEELIAGMNRKNVKLVVAECRGRELAALLVACKDIILSYDYIGFVHDKRKNKGMSFQTVGQSFMDILWENSIKNDVYIKNVITEFEEESRLGLLAPPAPYASIFFAGCAKSWTSNFDIANELAERLGIDCVMDVLKHPFVLGSTFWCRREALMPLFAADFKYTDFQPEPMDVDNTISHAIERILPYVAQSQGYYSGIMMTEEYGSLYLTNYQYMIREIIDKYVRTTGITRFDHISAKEDYLAEMCNSYKNIYVYGTGIQAKCCADYMYAKDIRIEGFLVSNGHKKQKEFRGTAVYEIDDVEIAEDDLVLLALNEKNRKEVIPELIKRGIKNIERYY